MKTLVIKRFSKYSALAKNTIILWRAHFTTLTLTKYRSKSHVSENPLSAAKCSGVLPPPSWVLMENPLRERNRTAMSLPCRAAIHVQTGNERIDKTDRQRQKHAHIHTHMHIHKHMHTHAHTLFTHTNTKKVSASIITNLWRNTTIDCID